MLMNWLPSRPLHFCSEGKNVFGCFEGSHDCTEPILCQHGALLGVLGALLGVVGALLGVLQAPFKLGHL